MPQKKKRKPWSKRARRDQAIRVAARIRERPWSEEANAARSAAQKGIPKSNEAKAAMYASKRVGRERTPEWLRVYEARLAELDRETRWAEVTAAAEARGLSPEDVKFAVSATPHPAKG